ncbi:MAG: hypothetical protein PF450_09305 [Bacteroidales bacterium]|jgi:hypothetical protein|nr:hypothetical protein [Bacteroidales bacterium]
MKYPHMWAKCRPGIIIPVFFLSCFMTSFEQGYYPDARSLALGKICSVPGTGPFPIANPAALAGISERAIGAGHTSPFLLKEIGISSLETILPVNPGTFHIQLANYGLKGYRDFKWETSYGMVLGENLSAGISFLFYHTISNGELNYLWTLGIGGGIIYKLSENSILGFHVLNPYTIGNYSDFGPLFPSVLSLGLSHKIYEDTKLFTEFSQSSNGLFRGKIGFEYHLKSELVLRAGYHTSPHSFSFGSGYRNRKFSIDMTFSWSTVPGFSPGIQILYFL